MRGTGIWHRAPPASRTTTPVSKALRSAEKVQKPMRSFCLARSRTRSAHRVRSPGSVTHVGHGNRSSDLSEAPELPLVPISLVSLASSSRSCRLSLEPHSERPPLCGAQLRAPAASYFSHMCSRGLVVASNDLSGPHQSADRCARSSASAHGPEQARALTESGDGPSMLVEAPLGRGWEHASAPARGPGCGTSSRSDQRRANARLECSRAAIVKRPLRASPVLGD